MSQNSAKLKAQWPLLPHDYMASPHASELGLMLKLGILLRRCIAHHHWPELPHANTAAALKLMVVGVTLTLDVSIQRHSAACHSYLHALIAALQLIAFGITRLSGMSFNPRSADSHLFSNQHAVMAALQPTVSSTLATSISRESCSAKSH